MSREPSRLIGYVMVVLIALAATLPFLNKAFHIDDILYLCVANQILKTPDSPYGDLQKSVVMWDAEDGSPASLFRTDYNPPLWKYILATTIHFWGPEEWKIHLVVAAVVAIAAVGLYRVSCRLTGWPVWSVAMIVLAPFYMPGQNCMLEPMVLCLAAWATHFQFRSWDTGKALPALIAGVLVGLAILTKYTSGLLLPIFFVGGLLYAKPRSLWFAAPAVAILGLWCLHNVIYYGQPHLTSHGVLFGPESWPQKALTVIRIVGGVSVFGPIWWYQLWLRGRAGRMALLSLVPASLLIAYLDDRQMRFTYDLWQLVPLDIQSLHFWLFTSLGTATIGAVLAVTSIDLFRNPKDWWQSKDDRILDVWITALLVFNVCCTPFNAVRHMLLAFVPMTWLSARQIPTGSFRFPAAILAMSTALGFTLAAADYEFANCYKRIAEENIRRDVSAGMKVWFTGNWGFTYYASREGALPLFVGTEDYGFGRPMPGDRIYHPVILDWKELDLSGKQWVEHRQPEGIVPLRLIAPGAHYYDVSTHALPWEVLLLPPRPDEGREGYQFPPLDHIQVFDVTKPQTKRSPWK